MQTVLLSFFKKRNLTNNAIHHIRGQCKIHINEKNRLVMDNVMRRGRGGWKRRYEGCDDKGNMMERQVQSSL
jgi:hypothetical protein